MNFVPLLPEFNLSRLKLLRSLEFWPSDLYWTADTHRAVVVEVFSTITSPVFSELVIVSTGSKLYHFSLSWTYIKILRTMSKVRPFKLVFLLEAPDYLQEQVRQVFARDLDFAVAEGHFDFLDSPPTIRVTE